MSSPQRWTPPSAGEFDLDFWARVDRLWHELRTLTRVNEDLALLGRVFYLVADTEATSDLLGQVRGWLQAVLEVGRRRGMVDSTLPIELQLRCLVAVLEVFDRWMLSDTAGSSGGVDALLSAQLEIVHRLLAVPA